MPVAGLRPGIPGQHAASRVQDRAAAVAFDDRDLDTLLVGEGGGGHTADARERQLEADDAEGSARVVTHERRVRDDEPARVGRAIGLRDVHLTWLRCERCAEEGVVAHVVRERLRRRGTALHDASPLATVEADRGGSADDAGIGALERAERPVDLAQVARLGPRDAVAERRVTREQAERELRAREHTADRVGLPVGLEGKALVEAGTRLGALGDGQRDAGKCEQEAREQCGEGSIAHANEGAGPPRKASARSGVMTTPVKGDARCSRHGHGNVTAWSPTPMRSPNTLPWTGGRPG